MIPLSESSGPRRTPMVTVALIGLCVLVFLYELTLRGQALDLFVERWGAVRVLVPILFFFWAFDLPAILVLGFWFLTQFFDGVGAITHASRATAAGGVAVWAPVAGFLLGLIGAKLLPGATRQPLPANPGVRR